MPPRCRPRADGRPTRRCKISGTCVVLKEKRGFQPDGRRYRCNKGSRQCIDRECYHTATDPETFNARRIQALFRGNTGRKGVHRIKAANTLKRTLRHNMIKKRALARRNAALPDPDSDNGDDFAPDIDDAPEPGAAARSSKSRNSKNSQASRLRRDALNSGMIVSSRTSRRRR